MDVVMGWPEWILSAVIFLNVISRAVKATGYRLDDKTSDAVYAASCFTYPAFWFGLLYWGGFFS